MKKLLMACVLCLCLLAASSVAMAAATPISEAGGALTTGEYILDKDVQLTGNLTIAKDQAVTIDLNGNILTGPGGVPVISIEGGSLTIKDSGSQKEHVGYVDSAGLWHNGAGSGTPVTLYGGVITGGGGNPGEGGTASRGGGVFVKHSGTTPGTVTLMGGNIAGNYATLGGGVMLEQNGSNTLTLMKDPTLGTVPKICYNIAMSEGGGVGAINRTFVYLLDGEVCYNTGRFGGGVLINGTLEMSGGKVHHNIATVPEGSTSVGASRGGGVRVNSVATFVMSGGSITDNQAISATVNGKTYTAIGGGVDQTSTMNVSGDVVIRDNFCNGTPNNVHVDTGDVITITGQLGSGAYIGYTKQGGTGLITENVGTNVAAFHADVDSVPTKQSIYNNEIWYNRGDGSTTDASQAVARVGGKLFTTLDAAFAYVARETATIELLQDITVKKIYYVPDKTDITLTASYPVTINCVNTIDNSLAYFTAVSGTKLTLSGPITLQGNGGKYTGRAVQIKAGAEGVINDPVEITGFKSAGSGGAVVVGGTFTMNGGYLRGNQASAGGGIMVSSGGVATIKGGEISGNHIYADPNNSSYFGSGVWSYYGTVNVEGGKIINNTSERPSGSIYRAGLGVSNGTLNLSGTPVVLGNTDGNGKECNTYVNASRVVTLVGKLEEGAAVGLCDAYKKGSNVTAAETGTDYYASSYQYFVPTQPGLKAVSGTNNVKLAEDQGSNRVEAVLTNVVTYNSPARILTGSETYTIRLEAETGYSLPKESEVAAAFPNGILPDGVTYDRKDAITADLIFDNAKLAGRVTVAVEARSNLHVLDFGTIAAGADAEARLVMLMADRGSTVERIVKGDVFTVEAEGAKSRTAGITLAVAPAAGLKAGQYVDIIEVTTSDRATHFIEAAVTVVSAPAGSSVPKTGDSTPIALFGMMMALAAMGMAVAVQKRKA